MLFSEPGQRSPDSSYRTTGKDADRAAAKDADLGVLESMLRTIILLTFALFLAFTVGCGGSAKPANGVLDAQFDDAGNEDAADADADGGSADAASLCDNLAATAQATLQAVVAAQRQCDAESDCTNLLWPTCLGCGAYAVNNSGSSVAVMAIAQACQGFTAQRCTPPPSPCPVSYGTACSSGQCLANPPMMIGP